MDITLDSLNGLNYEQALCFNIVICSFVATHQSELLEAELMDETLIRIYSNNVENMIPESYQTGLVQSTNGMAWNLLQTATENLLEIRNTDFCKCVIEAFADAWDKANN